MRFEDLHGLTSLPVEHVRHRFRNEDVITVLPVRGATERDSVFVATPGKLAVVTNVSPVAEHWMTYWAPWDAVRVADAEAGDAGVHGMTLWVGSLSFHARLTGPEGQRVVEEFAAVVAARRSAAASA